MRYCKWHCTSLEKAEDLTQDTFLKLFINIAEYEGKNKFKAYLYTIANHLCIDESRKIQTCSLEEEEMAVTECKEFAKAMGCILRTARSRVRNALKIMKKEQRNG